MLPVLDDLDRALKIECPSPEYAQGVRMIRDRMYEALVKLGLEPIETAGQKFDPHLHQAVERVETKDAGEDTILEEFQKGYRFKGKLLRPSMVKVAVHS
jgi:molecular chaperone GrpE